MKEKDKDEMKNFIKAWEESKKFRLLQSELEKVRKKYADFTLLSNPEIEKYLSQIEVTREQLEKIIANDKEMQDANDEFNWIEKLSGYKNLTKDQFFVKFQRSLVIFYIALLGYQKVENYEICALVQKVIDIQVKLQTKIMNELFACTEDDFAHIKLVQDRIIQTILIDKQ